MSPTQLALTDHPVPTPTATSVPTYLGWGDAHPTTLAARKAASAIQRFCDRYGTAPDELHCHPSDAEAIGPSCAGVAVIGDGHARNLFLAGPQPLGETQR